MAITTAFCTSAKGEFLQGIHEAADTYKCALYTSSATMSAATTAYSATNEVANGNGYTTGGATLTGYSVTTDGTTGILDFTTDASWASSTITARGCLIYNSSQSNKAIAVYDFGADIVSTNGTFTVVFPAASAAAGLIKIA
jgi:hypothetical protein